MQKLSAKSKITLQLVFLFIGLFALVPISNKETVLNLIIPYFEIRKKIGGGVFFVSNLFNVLVFILLVICFFSIRDYLKKKKSAWRSVLYAVLLFWFITNIKTIIGSEISSHRKGLNKLEFLSEQSKFHYQIDTLGNLHALGVITIKNYGSDTIKCQGILHKENFGLPLDYAISDVSLPYCNKKARTKYIEIPPKTTYPYSVEFDAKLIKLKKSTFQKMGVDINRITILTLVSNGEKKVFNE